MGSLWYLIFLYSGVLSVFWGTFAALSQLGIKRLYAYSALVNVGYVSIALAYGNLEGFVAAINYLLIYFCSALILFGIIMLLRKALNSFKIKLLNEYNVYVTYNFLLAVMLSFTFFSLAGIPPLAGFFIKFFLFKFIFFYEFLWGSFFFIILITSVISAFYYVRCVSFIFFSIKRKPFLFLKINFFCTLILVTFVFFLLLFFFFQPVFYLILEIALSAVFL